MEQLSETVTNEIFGAGTSDAHTTLTGAGAVIDGGVVSETLITCCVVDVFPQASVAL